MVDLKKDIGERIASLRNSHRPRYTQEALAEAVGVERNTVYRWERGLSYPEARHMESLAKVLGVSVQQLCGPQVEAENDMKLDQAIDYAKRLIETVESKRAEAKPSPSNESLLLALTNLEKENQALRDMLAKIPAQWIARLAVKSRDDLFAVAARAFLTGDLSELQSLKLPAKEYDRLAKMLHSNKPRLLPE